jgi:hypothetical protein
VTTWSSRWERGEWERNGLSGITNLEKSIFSRTGARKGSKQTLCRAQKEK